MPFCATVGGRGFDDGMVRTLGSANKGRGCLVAVATAGACAAVGPAAAAPVRVMTVPAGERLAHPRLAALPSGDIVVAQMDTDLLYAARTGGRWTPVRRLPRLISPYAAVSAVSRGDRLLVAWLGHGSARGSRRLAFADFRGAARAPILGHVFTHQVVLDPVAIPGVARGARAVWPVLDLPGLFEGRTDPQGNWRTAHFLPGAVSPYPSLAVAASPDARRLVVIAVPEAGGLTAVTWSAAGAADNLPPLRPLYTTPVLQSVAQMAAAFRAREGAAVVIVSRSATDPVQMQVQAVSIDGDVAAAPRPVVAGERLSSLDPPQVASLLDGRLVAVWRRVAPPGVQLVMANERTVGGEWTPPLALSTAGGRAGIPSLVVTASGRPVLAWSDGGRVRMRALRVGPEVTAGRPRCSAGPTPGAEGPPCPPRAGARSPWRSCARRAEICTSRRRRCRTAADMQRSEQ